MTSADFANLSVYRGVWTTAIAPVAPIFSKKLFYDSKIKKICSEYFSFIDSEDPLYFQARNDGLGGSTSGKLSDLKLMFLETLRHREWDQGDL